MAAEGDSITHAADPSFWVSQYPALIEVQLQKRYQSLTTYVSGVSGSTLVDLTNRAATLDAQIIGGRVNVLTVLEGHNDFATYAASAANFVAALKVYCQARRSAGWKVVLITVLPSTQSSFNAWRTTVNSGLRSDSSFYDTLVDVDVDAFIGADASAADLTYYLDGTHLTATGQALLAPYVQAGVILVN